VVRIRLKRVGRVNTPLYRIVAADARFPRDGKALDESLGSYDPRQEKDEKKVTLNRERILAWLDKGAQPSNVVRVILKKNGIYIERKSKSARRKKKDKKAE
jgi:small subunit ribosomal protein S16